MQGLRCAALGQPRPQRAEALVDYLDKVALIRCLHVRCAQSPSENLPGLMSAVSSPMGIPQATGHSLMRHCPRPSILAG
jgi:hypothetical protein